MSKPLGLDADGVQKTMRGKDYTADALGNLGLGLMGNLIGQLTYFYTDKAGLAVAAVGIVLATAKITDALADIWVGHLVDSSKGGNHKYYSWMFKMAIPAAVITILMFTVPSTSAQWVKIAYVLVTNLLFSSVIYTFISTPFSAVMVVRTKSQSERSSMGLFRAITSYGSGMFIVIATIPLTNALGGTQNAWIKYGVMMGLVILLSFLICYRNGRKAKFPTDFDAEQSKVEPEDVDEDVKLMDSLKMLFKNKYWVIVLLFNLITQITNTVSVSSSAYYCKWIFGDDNLVSALGAVGFVASVLGFAASKTIINKLGVRETINFGLVGAALCALVRSFNPDNFYMYVGTSLVGSFVQIPLMVLYGVILGMAVDYNEYKYDKKLVAMASGAVGFGNKVGAGLGSIVLSAFLAFGAYDATLSVATTSMKNAIYGFTNYLPIVINLLMFLIFTRFDLEKKLPAMRKAVAARHAHKE